MSSRAVSFSLTLHDSKQYGLDSLVLASGNSTLAVASRYLLVAMFSA